MNAFINIHPNLNHDHVHHMLHISHTHQSKYKTNNNQDSCIAQWNDIKMAMKAKTTSDPDEAQRILAQTHYKKNLGSDLKQSPTAGVIWEMKEKPCWDEVV